MILARTPAAIISLASAGAGSCHSGNKGFRPVPEAGVRGRRNGFQKKIAKRDGGNTFFIARWKMGASKFSQSRLVQGQGIHRPQREAHGRSRPAQELVDRMTTTRSQRS